MSRSTASSRPYTAAEYLESLDDGRSVLVHGDSVRNVAEHPAFTRTARMFARLYGALHDRKRRETLTTPTDTGSGGRTHRYFKVTRTPEELVAARDAIAEWARLTFGWFGRTPDYKAALLATMGANAEFYGEYRENALRWYAKAQERVMFLNHAFVNPPVHGSKSMNGQGLKIRVVRENSRGLVVSGAKGIATGAMFTHCCFVGHVGPPPADKASSPTFIVETNSPGLQMVCRPSYELNSSLADSPFDHPLSSRLDENDAVLVFNKVLIPWENVLIYDPVTSVKLMDASGFRPRAQLHTCTRLAVKLEFIVAAVLQALEDTSDLSSIPVQERLGELIGWRNLFRALSDAMVHSPVITERGVVQPNLHYGNVSRMMAQEIYPRLRSTVAQLLGTNLIYGFSHVKDLEVGQMRDSVTRYLRGNGRVTSEARQKILRVVWDCVNSEFAARQELYELLHMGTPAAQRVRNLFDASLENDLASGVELIGEFMSEYDTEGWTAPDLMDAQPAVSRRRAR
jgi:4-hydroxyphenylacetate 3-monooxygenase